MYIAIWKDHAVGSIYTTKVASYATILIIWLLEALYIRLASFNAAIVRSYIASLDSYSY